MKKLLFILGLGSSLPCLAWSYFQVSYVNNTDYLVYFDNDTPTNYQWTELGNWRGADVLQPHYRIDYSGIMDHNTSVVRNHYKTFGFYLREIINGQPANYQWVFAALNNPSIGSPKIYWGVTRNGETAPHYTEVSKGLYYDKYFQSYKVVVTFIQPLGCATPTGLCPLAVRISGGRDEQYEQLYTWALPWYKAVKVANASAPISSPVKLSGQTQLPW